MQTDTGPGRDLDGRAVALCMLFLVVTPRVVSAQASGDGHASARSYPIDVAAAARPALRAHVVSEPIRVDGRLDEAAWAVADSTDAFITTLPRVGFPASERTVARVLVDGENLYVGGYMYDSEPRRLHSQGLEQDFDTQESDLFGVVLDTFLDRQNGLMFAVSPAGALFDAQAFNDSREVNRAWEGVIHVATAVHADGWSAEMAIPLKTLRFRATEGAQEWGLNFIRRVRRLNEDSYWAPLERQFRVHKMSRAGTLSGLVGLRQGRNLTLKPYVSAAAVGGAARRALGDDGGELDAGFDLKYGITSRLTLDVTALTDFSQVEVDQEQVNLTRFSLFFPEKRDFFLENDGIFTLGDVTERNYRTGSGPQDFKLFYSRSIGLSRDRRPIPIVGGARLSGRAGSTEIGLLDMQTRAGGGEEGENFAVLRLRQNFGPAADAGVLLINRQGTGHGAGGDYNRSIGFDANVRALRYLIVNSYFAATHEPDAPEDRTSAYVQAGWRDPVWDFSAFLKRVGDGFNPGVGFIRRRGIRQAFGTVGAHPQPRIPFIAEINPYFDVSAIENVDGRLETRWYEPGLAVTFLDGALLNLRYENRFERLFETTPIAGAEVAAGDYRFSAVSASYESNQSRKMAGRVGVTRGSFYDGDRTSLSARLGYRPNPHLMLEGFAEHNDLELGGRSFRADVFGGRARFAASTRFFASAFVQYVEGSDELVTNLRLNYIHAPLSDVFLVLTERRGLDGQGTIERVVTLKATKLVAF